MDKIEESAKAASPKLDEKATEIQKAVDEIATELEKILPKSQPVVSFLRRIFSREFIIAVVAIATIGFTNTGTEEAIGIAVAASGLALGRGVAKGGPGTNNN